MESRGNEKYGNEVQIGVEEACSTLHFGPRWDQDAFRTASYSRHNAAGYDKDFHKYEFIWDESGIKFFIDGSEVGFAAVGDGFWQRGRFSGQNIWENGTKMAPFDQEVWVIFQMLNCCKFISLAQIFLKIRISFQFHFLINLAAGGNNGYFPDGVTNQNGNKPWANHSPRAMKDFWLNRNQWLRSWRDRERASLIVDSVKVWAI